MLLYDYLIYQKSFLLYAPDLEEYKQQRGFYLEYESLPAPVITSSDALEAAMREQAWLPYSSDLVKCYQEYMGACDGHATDKILKKLSLYS